MLVLSFDNSMREVLEQPRYDKLTGRAFDFREVIEDAIIRFIDFLINRFSFNMPDITQTNTDMIAVFFAVIGALVLIIVIIAIIQRRLKRGKKIHEGNFSDVFEEITTLNMSSDDWLSLSETSLKSCLEREAVRYRYIAALVALSDKKIIRLNASMTNANIAMELASAAPALVPSFSKVADCFHRIWFGYKGINNQEFIFFADEVEVIRKHTI